MRKIMLLAVVCAGALAFADAPDIAPAGPAVTSATVQTVAAIPWTAIVVAVLGCFFALYVKLLGPHIRAVLEATAADKTASAFKQQAAAFGDKLETLVEAQAGHMFDDLKALGPGETAQQALATATNDLLAGLGDEGKALATQFLGTGGAVLYDAVEGLIKSAVQGKQAAAAAAGAAAARAAVPLAKAAVAGPAAAAAIDKTA